MNTQQQVEKKWAFALKPLQNADTDFMISRQAIICTTESFDSQINYYFFLSNKNIPVHISRTTKRDGKLFVKKDGLYTYENNVIEKAIEKKKVKIIKEKFLSSTRVGIMLLRVIATAAGIIESL